MRAYHRRGSAWGVALLIAGHAGLVSADERAPSRTEGSLRKLGRGIANVATCPAELARTPELVTHREGTLAGLTVGVAQGAWRALQRGAVGILEIATFYLEIPRGFQPIMRPEFVWAHGGWADDEQPPGGDER